MINVSVTDEDLKKKYPRCCLMDYPLNVKTYRKLCEIYTPDLLEKRLNVTEAFLAFENCDFTNIEVTVQSIIHYIELYIDGYLD